jgi:hypothetical protein
MSDILSRVALDSALVSKEKEIAHKLEPKINKPLQPIV